MGPYLHVDRDALPAGASVVVTHALPERETTENPGGKREYRFKWKGDEVVGSDPATVIYGKL